MHSGGLCNRIRLPERDGARPERAKCAPSPKIRVGAKPQAPTGRRCHYSSLRERTLISPFSSNQKTFGVKTRSRQAAMSTRRRSVASRRKSESANLESDNDVDMLNSEEESDGFLGDMGAAGENDDLYQLIIDLSQYLCSVKEE